MLVSPGKCGASSVLHIQRHLGRSHAPPDLAQVPSPDFRCRAAAAASSTVAPFDGSGRERGCVVGFFSSLRRCAAGATRRGRSQPVPEDASVGATRKRAATRARAPCQTGGGGARWDRGHGSKSEISLVNKTPPPPIWPVNFSSEIFGRVSSTYESVINHDHKTFPKRHVT